MGARLHDQLFVTCSSRAVLHDGTGREQQQQEELTANKLRLTRSITLSWTAALTPFCKNYVTAQSRVSYVDSVRPGGATVGCVGVVFGFPMAHFGLGRWGSS
jgi:hypothetical protein